jgi:hypothetical protein
MHVFGYEPREGETLYGPPVRHTRAQARAKAAFRFGSL